MDPDVSSKSRNWFCSRWALCCVGQQNRYSVLVDSSEGEDSSSETCTDSDMSDVTTRYVSNCFHLQYICTKIWCIRVRIDRLYCYRTRYYRYASAYIFAETNLKRNFREKQYLLQIETEKVKHVQLTIHKCGT